jgi:flagellar motor switch protein FliN/FliY
MAKANAEAATVDMGKTQVQPAEFPEVTAQAGVTGTGQFDILLDMDVSVVVALGDTRIPVRRLLQLGPGSVLELDKTVDAPADLYLRGTKIAEGEIVVVDERFGIRIQRILDMQTPDAAGQA